MARNNRSKINKAWRVPKKEGKLYKKNPLCDKEMELYIKREILIKRYEVID